MGRLLRVFLFCDMPLHFPSTFEFRKWVLHTKWNTIGTYNLRIPSSFFCSSFFFSSGSLERNNETPAVPLFAIFNTRWRQRPKSSKTSFSFISTYSDVSKCSSSSSSYFLFSYFEKSIKIFVFLIALQHRFINHLFDRPFYKVI